MGRADTGWISGRSVAAQYDPTLRLPHPAYVPYLLLFLPIYTALIIRDRSLEFRIVEASADLDPILRS